MEHQIVQTKIDVFSKLKYMAGNKLLMRVSKLETFLSQSLNFFISHFSFSQNRAYSHIRVNAINSSISLIGEHFIIIESVITSSTHSEVIIFNSSNTNSLGKVSNIFIFEISLLSFFSRLHSVLQILLSSFFCLI